MENIKPGYLRVTEILSPFSGLNNIPQQILETAAERGTKVHKICDALINDIGVGEVDDKLSGYVDSFKQWMPKEFIANPQRFYCDKYMITGECDGVYRNGNQLVLVDFKTPAKESRTWALQGSAYCYLARQAGYDISWIEFVKLSKNGKAPEVLIYQENFDLFVKCLDVYRHFFKSGGQENYLDYL